MSSRRMFSHDIVSSDAFLDMPTSSRELYFQLGMYADDDGFVNPKKIVRIVGASNDDIKVLLGKRFIIGFESGVVVIKHWLIHNLIRSDRYKETMYVDEKKMLKIKGNKAYTENKEFGIPDDYQLATQYRRVEDSKDKSSIVEREGKTPSQVMRDFIDNKENTQEQLVNYLVEKGIPREKAITELSKFLSYWTELNKSGTKQKWEMQDTFEVKRRLGTWFGNIKQDKTKQLIDLDKI